MVRASAMLFAVSASVVLAPVQESAERYVVEYYYKVRWGHQQEFIELFRKNHFPILEKEREHGRILEVWGQAPRYHGTEDGRWDYRVTIVFRDAAAAVAPSAVTATELRQLYPDSARFAAEERQRFEILEAHWDLPIVPVALK